METKASFCSLLFGVDASDHVLLTHKDLLRPEGPPDELKIELGLVPYKDRLRFLDHKRLTILTGSNIADSDSLAQIENSLNEPDCLVIAGKDELIGNNGRRGVSGLVFVPVTFATSGQNELVFVPGYTTTSQVRKLNASLESIFKPHS